MQDSKPILVSVRGIAVDGISFRHQVAIPHRYVAVRYRSSSGTETLVTKLSWCRFERAGHYISSGQLTVESQLYFNLDIDRDMLKSTK
jgi:hypothetical protein